MLAATHTVSVRPFGRTESSSHPIPTFHNAVHRCCPSIARLFHLSSFRHDVLCQWQCCYLWCVLRERDVGMTGVFYDTLTTVALATKRLHTFLLHTCPPRLITCLSCSTHAVRIEA